MRKIAIIAALLLTTTGAQAGEQYLTLGRGTESCATWQSSAAEMSAGRDWIQGFWSGLNLSAPEGMKTVGTSTDIEGIVAELKGLCARVPSGQLLPVTMTIYRHIREREFPGTK